MIGTVLKGWRTLIFNFVAGGLTGLGAMNAVDLGAVAPWMPFILAGGNIVLRLMTTTPVGQSE